MACAVKEKKIAVIAGAGPAGLTASLELLRRSNILPIVFEADKQVGGISKTINFGGNRMDLGGPFFLEVRLGDALVAGNLADCRGASSTRQAVGNPISRTFSFNYPNALASDASDSVMLVRQRLSRIFIDAGFSTTR